MRSLDMAQSCGDQSPRLPMLTRKGPKMCCCGQFDPDVVTTYKRDYQAWNFPKHQPFHHHDNLKVFQGVCLLNNNGRQPMEDTTSYKTSFLPYQLETLRRMDRPLIRSNSLQGDQTCCGRFRRYPRSIADDPNRFLSTTHADYIQHAMQRTMPRPIPRIPGRPRSHDADIEYKTTMKEDFVKWDLPRCPSTPMKSFSQLAYMPCSPDANRCPRCHGLLRPKDPQSRPGSFLQ